MTVDTVVPLGSVTKQFTAAAILQLRDQGKLSLDDDITKWLPDFETRGNKVTLRHLLGHTSGIANLTKMPELRAMQLMRNPTATRDAVYMVINRYPFQFPTGTMEIYSNSNFWLIGLIFEKASGDDVRGGYKTQYPGASLFSSHGAPESGSPSATPPLRSGLIGKYFGQGHNQVNWNRQWPPALPQVPDGPWAPFEAL